MLLRRAMARLAGEPLAGFALLAGVASNSVLKTIVAFSLGGGRFRTLAAAGLFEGMDKLMDAPVVQTWQLLRLAARRVYGVPATNESDRIACDFLGNLNGKN